MKELQINIVNFIAAAYSSSTIDVRLFMIVLCVPRPLLNHRSLACYCICSLKIPYKVIDNVQKTSF